MSIVKLTEDQEMIRKVAHDFSEKEIKPVASEHDRKHEFPKDIVAKLGELGFMGMVAPEQYGGSGADYLSYIIAVEEISGACASTGAIMSVNNSLVCEPIKTFGDEYQKKTYLPGLASTDKLGCFMLSEPEAGSDPASMSTTARKKGNNYILNGAKCWITNGAEADVAIVFATTDATKRNKGVSAFIVDMNAEGLTVGKLEDKLGIKATSTA